MVSVFEGQLQRTWFFNNQNRNHVISLYHDTITGVRSAMLDFIEIRGSNGNSSLIMEGKGHRIFFSVDDLPGYIEIRREGWTGFGYCCVINDMRIPEAMETVASNQDARFKPKVISMTQTPDESSEFPLSWYYVKTVRLADNTTTHVHRRFRDFAELNSQVKQNLKGNHLRNVLPPLPEKPLKNFTDHQDPAFLEDRRIKLEIFIQALVAVPHVSDMICVKAFLGLMEQVREFSISFHVPTLGLTLQPYANPTDLNNTPVLVGQVLKPELCEGVLPGDSISKINGMPVAGTSFAGVIHRIKALPRPLVVHFIQVIGTVVESSNGGSKGVVEDFSNMNLNSSSSSYKAEEPLPVPAPTVNQSNNKPVTIVPPAAPTPQEEGDEGEWNSYNKSTTPTPNSRNGAASNVSPVVTPKPPTAKQSAILEEMIGGSSSTSKGPLMKPKYNADIFGGDSVDDILGTPATTTTTSAAQEEEAKPAAPLGWD